jgi:hypothetical protein
MGAFTERSLAEDFQLFHNYDRIEEFELNPTTPKVDGFQYLCRCSPRQYPLNLEVFRTSNDNVHLFPADGEVELTDSFLLTYVWANDEQHALKIWTDILAQCRTQQRHVYRRVRKQETVKKNDAVLSPESVSKLYKQTLVWEHRNSFKLIFEELYEKV